MDDIASSGHVAWSVDIRGYGRSWKPPRMVGATGGEEPIVDTNDAVEDLDAAIRYILAVSGARQVALVGWSWGATITAALAAQAPDYIQRLVLYGAQWMRETSQMVTPQALSQSYRVIDPERLVDRWFSGLKPAHQKTVLERGWVGTLTEALKVQNRDANGVAEPFSAPNGCIKDIAQYWMAGRPLYDPGRINMPCLMVVGTDDVDTPPSQSRKVFNRLGSQAKSFMEVADGTHFMLFEPVREELFSTVREFLSR
jgi:pimeloyl-ACP methyl ester carboxylesterase